MVKLMAGCPICSDEKRLEIEMQLLAARCNPSSMDSELDRIAKEFKLLKRDLKVHMLMHSFQLSKETSLAGQINLDEAGMIHHAAIEYLGTLKRLSKKIDTTLDSNDDVGLTRLLQGPVVELYKVCGSELRSCTETLLRMNQAVNGKEDSVTSSLKSLVTALRGSEPVD